MSTLKRYNGTSWETIGGSITGDTLPIGSEIDYTGSSVPAGWEEVADYSINEINTGKKWIDGKPIYRKCYSGNTGNDNISIDSGITNLNQIISLDGMINDADYGLSMKCGGYLDGNNNYSFLYYVWNTNKINCYMASAWMRGTYTFIIEYTKTTD